MRKLLLALALAGSFVSTAPAATPEKPTQAAKPAPPRMAPEFVIQQTNGKQLLLSSYRGKPVVLALMYATCSHCQHAAGLLNSMQADFAAKGVQILGATFGEGDAYRVDAFIKQFQVAFPCGYSNAPSVLTFLNQPADVPYYVPILVFIDKKGMIRRQVIGDEKFLDEKDEPANIRAEVEKLLKPAATVTSSSAKRTPKS